VPGALGDQGLPVDEQRRIVQARGRGAGNPLGHGDDQQPGQERGGQGVDDQDSARPQHPARFGDRGAQVGDVLEDLPGADDIRAGIGQRQGGDVALDRGLAVCGRLHQGGPGEVHAGHPVAEPGDVRREQARPAAHVHQHRAGPGGRRNQRRAGPGQPVQHGERAAWIPPLGG
jgi:hypothetical protein